MDRIQMDLEEIAQTETLDEPELYDLNEVGKSVASEGDQPDSVNHSSQEKTESNSIKDVSNSQITIVHGNQVVPHLQSQGVKLSFPSRRDLIKTQAVYVHPGPYQQVLEEIRTSRMVHLVGKDHVGKFAMAQALAVELAFPQSNQSNLSIRVMRCTEMASILDLLEDDNCPKNSIFIMRHAFRVPGLEPMEFHRNPGVICEALKNNNQYLVLTSSEKSGESIHVAEKYTINVDVPDKKCCNQLLEKHFDWYDIPKDWRTDAKRIAIRTLTRPYHFDLFALRLRERIEPPTVSDIDLLIRNIQSTELSTRNWFAELDTNAKFFTMLAQLCSDLSLEQLWAIYCDVVDNLRKAGVSLRSPLNYGSEDLLDAAQAHLSDAETVEFNNPIYEAIALNQAQNNYKQQFRHLLPLFTEKIAASAATANQSYSDREASRDLRISLATAIGKLGQTNLELIKPTLYTLGRDAHPAVRTAVAHALRQVCTNPEAVQPVLNLLHGWKNHPSSTIRWSVAATFERLHVYFAETTVQALESMAGDADGRVRGAVAHAMESIFRRDPEATMDILLAWLNKEKAEVDRTVVQTMKRIAVDKRQVNRHFRSADRRLQSLPLFSKLLIIGTLNQLKAGMELLGNWSLDDRTPDILPHVEDMIVHAAQLSGSKRRKRMVDCLQEWGTRDGASVDLSFLGIIGHIEALPPLITIEEEDLSSISDEEIDIIDDQETVPVPDTDIDIAIDIEINEIS